MRHSTHGPFVNNLFRLPQADSAPHRTVTVRYVFRTVPIADREKQVDDFGSITFLPHGFSRLTRRTH